VAQACFRAALCSREGLGWVYHEVKVWQVHNMLCQPQDITRIPVNRLRPNADWLALTRANSHAIEAEERLQRVGRRLYV
jgi:hypothetical protein